MDIISSDNFIEFMKIIDINNHNLDKQKDILYSNLHLLDSKDENGMTLLTHLILDKRLSLIKIVVELNSKLINELDNQSKHPLFFAIITKHTETIKYLLSLSNLNKNYKYKNISFKDYAKRTKCQNIINLFN